MTLNKDILDFIAHYLDSCIPDLNKLADGDTNVIFPEKLARTFVVIQDVMTQLRGVMLEYPNGLKPDVEKFYCITTCDSYAEKVWLALLDEKSKNHAHILVLRFDVPGETYENKTVGYHARYNDIPSVPQRIVDLEEPFKDGQKMPAPTESIFKNQIMKKKLLNYLLMYFLRNYQEFINLNSAIIVDGILLDRRTMSQLGFSVGDSEFEEVSRNPLVVRKISTPEGHHDLQVRSLDHHEYVCHSGEADVGVVYWMEHFQGNTMVCAKDGDLLVVFALYLDSHPEFTHDIFIRKQMSIGNQRIDNPNWEKGATFASGRKKSKTKTLIQKNPIYYDIRLLCENICSKMWYTENATETTQALLAKYNFVAKQGDPYSPQIHPVPLMFALFSLCGNDYNSSFYRCGAQKVIDLFGGSCEIFRHLVCKSTYSITFSNRDSLKHCCGDGPDSEFSEGQTTVSIIRYGIVYRVFKRVVFEIIARAPLKKQGYSSANLTLALETLRQNMDKAQLKEHHTYSDPSKASLRAICCRIAWYLFYFANGGHKFAHMIIPDPLETGEDGVPIHGWERSSSFGPQVTSGGNFNPSDLKQTCKFSTRGPVRDIYWSHE